MFLKNVRPIQLGYRMPAEWEPHLGTWLSWPSESGISFPDAYGRVLPTFGKMINALARSEKVFVNVGSKADEARARSFIEPALLTQVEFVPIVTQEPWCRDHGPVFVLRKESPRAAIVDWDYNAWGGKYKPFDKDNAVPQQIGQRLSLPRFTPGIVLEGGSIDVNGSGTVLTTESCLLNPNRNPHLSHKQIEEYLCDYLGVSKVLWLGEGIEGDDTDGHIDDITRFVNRTTVVTAMEENPRDPNYEILRGNYMRLKKMSVEDGTPLEVITLPMPSKIEREDLRLPASYANFYIGNKVVLLPVFEDPNDQAAIEVLTKCFPDRAIVPIDCRELIWGLGTFHCLTQQQPLG